MIIAVNYFRKTLHHRCLTSFWIPYRGKKCRGKVTNFSQVTNIFPRLNFNPILFNPTRTFPTYFKTRQRTFPDFIKTLPNKLTRPHFLEVNRHVKFFNVQTITIPFRGLEIPLIFVWAKGNLRHNERFCKQSLWLKLYRHS